MKCILYSQTGVIFRDDGEWNIYLTDHNAYLSEYMRFKSTDGTLKNRKSFLYDPFLLRTGTARNVETVAYFRCHGAIIK